MHEEIGGGIRAARLAEAKALILRGFDDPRLSAATAARRLGISTRYLHMLFEGDGLSFLEFVTNERLRQAARMLREPEFRHLRVIDVALDCGFGDVRSFNRAFRHRFGCNPSEARRP